MKTKRGRLLLALAMAIVPMGTLSSPAFSQSCALCYTQAAASGSRMIEALRSGILVLIIPPTLMWLVIAMIAYNKRNRFKHAGSASESGSDW
jgi:hypothetical protein